MSDSQGGATLLGYSEVQGGLKFSIYVHKATGPSKVQNELPFRGNLLKGFVDLVTEYMKTVNELNPTK